jgi:hypothetical protein
MDKYYYKSYGVNIKSDFEIPDLIEDKSESPDVIFKSGSLSIGLKSEERGAFFFDPDNSEFIFRISKIATYSIKQGKTIIVDPDPGSAIEDVNIYLLGTAFGVLLHQRGILPIHGSAVLNGNEAVIFAGDTAAGKSTLVAGCAVRGYGVVSDDISALSLNNTSKITISPGIPHIKLCEDALKFFDLKKQIHSTSLNQEKYKVNILKAGFIFEPSVLNKIIIIEPSERSDFLTTEIYGTEKFQKLMKHTYRPWAVHKLGLTSNHIKLVAKIASNIRVFCVKRPVRQSSIDLFIDYIEETLLKQL